MDDKKFDPNEATLDKFDPTKAQLTTLVDKYKDLQIKDVDDKEGYDLLYTAQQELKKVAANIRITAKDYRANAIKFQKTVIAMEKEMIKVIEPTIETLTERRKVIDDIKEAAKRDKLLPERREKLKEIDVELTDEQITTMSDVEFDEYFLAKKEAILEAKENEIKEREAKVEKEKADKKLKDETEKKAREDAIEQAKLDKLKADAEKEKAVADAIQAGKDKATKLKLDQEENDRIKKQAEADLAKKEKEEKAEVERQKKLAPDKEKLIAWAEEIDKIKIPKGLFKESIIIVKRFQNILIELSIDIKKRSENL